MRPPRVNNHARVLATECRAGDGDRFHFTAWVRTILPALLKREIRHNTRQLSLEDEIRQRTYTVAGAIFNVRVTAIPLYWRGHICRTGAMRHRSVGRE